MSKHPRQSTLGRIVQWIVRMFSGEWILDYSEYTANGGTVVLARTLWISFWIYLPAFLIKTSMSPGRVPIFDLRQGIADIAETIPWLGAILGSTYAALYTRFSSQWTYLAGLYNQIVQTKAGISAPISRDQQEVINSWIAGFIEDAEELHLATKPMFATAIRHWLSDQSVSDWYVKHTAGGAPRLEALRSRLNAIHSDANQVERVKASKRLKKGAAA